MLSTSTIRLWSKIHTWTSLVCTLFLLMLCVTGLPLVFYEELEHALGRAIEAPPMPAETPKASLDRIVEAARSKHPGEIVAFVSWSKDDPNLVFLWLIKSWTAPADDGRSLVVDERTAAVLGEPTEQKGFLHIVFQLHVDLFAGLAGKLFLGFMGLLFVVAIVSGVVLYGPFMRRLRFGTVRTDRSPRIRWLDLHNLLGVATVAWALIVGGTGVLNTWADLVIKYWQYDQVTAMTAPYRDRPPPSEFGSLDEAVETARRAAPSMTPSFVAFPGSTYASRHHYGVFMRGDAPLTSRLLKPVLVDAVRPEIAETREMPWYVNALLLSQPLHFGDYGGMPLKIVWALLDIVTIVVLGSGLYLWLVRRRGERRLVRNAAGEEQCP